MSYSPRYVPTEEIPVQVPDDYSDYEKISALEVAESSLELDLNNGSMIPSGELDNLMKAAIKQKATCELVKGADDPNDVTLGDISDDGTTKQDYAMVFCDRYDELVDKIKDTDALDGDVSGVEPYTYTTRDPNPDDKYGHNTNPDSWRT